MKLVDKLIDNQEAKEIIFLPSLSAGAYASPIKKKLEVSPGVSYRFWEENTPEPWRYPYFLLTAGHLYKKIDVRDDWGLDPKSTLVFTDSGGFQIATGALKWDMNLRDQIFNWLENNGDIAANIDIPPRVTYEGHFQEALDISLDNFKYFEKKQTGKTKFLNVVQGSNPTEFDCWYNKVKDLEFNGWCIGSSRRLVDFMYILSKMIKDKEFLKTHNKWIHLLGISKVSDFLILAQIQRCMNLYTGNRITVSTDSSSPGQYPIFGQMIWAPNWKDQVFNMLYFAKSGNYQQDMLKKHIPSMVDHPGVESFTYDIANEWSTEAVTRATYHNLHMYIYTTKHASSLINNCTLDILSELIPSDLVQVLKSIEEMFNSPDPTMVYERYKTYYEKFGGTNVNNIDKSVITDFFDTTPVSNAQHEKEMKKAAKLKK